MNKDTAKETEPMILALAASALWGISGTATQVLFQDYNFPPSGLVTIRCLIAGLILFAWIKPKWPKGDSTRLVLFAVFGILPAQLFYFTAIAYSNVVIALLLQYLFLPMVILYELFTGRFNMTRMRSLMILFTILGTLLVILGGGGALHLSVSPMALVMGILSGVGVACYTLFSPPLTRKYSSASITCWSILIVSLITAPIGISSLLYSAPILGTENMLLIFLLVMFVAIFGTLLPFELFLRALKRLAATEGAVVVAMEPVFAAIASFFVFGSLLSFTQYIGGALMLIALAILRIITPEGKIVKRTKESVDIPTG